MLETTTTAAAEPRERCYGCGGTFHRRAMGCTDLCRSCRAHADDELLAVAALEEAAARVLLDF